MKIKKFNESVDIFDTELPYFGYKEYENSDSWCLVFYNVGGYVDGSILFENREDAENYVINYVNYYLLNESIDEYFAPEQYFDNFVDARDWLNNYNQNSEPSIDLINMKKAENIKLHDKFEMLNNSKKYNL